MPAKAKAAKRSAQAQAAVEVPAQKKPKQDPLVAGVLDALQQAGSLPESCRAMLAAAVPGCLGTPAAERHEHQAMLVSWIGEVIEGLRAKRQADLEGADAEAADAERSRQGLLAIVAEAKATLSTEEESVAAREATAKEAEKAADLARTGVTEKTEAQRQGDARMVEAGKDKQVVEAALEWNLKPLKEEDGFQVVQVEGHMQVLVPIAKRLALDESLLIALPSVSTRHPSKRGGFDCMVLDQLESSLRNHAAQLTVELEVGAPAMQERAAAVVAAQGELDAAEEALRTAKDALEAARAKQGQAASALKDAEGAVEAFDLGRSAAVAAREEKAAALQNFTGYNVECFNMLRDKAAATAGA